MGQFAIANGNLKIKETGETAHLALNTTGPGNYSFVTYATGHENDADYKLEYLVYPTSSATDYINMSDGIYMFSKENVNNFGYSVRTVLTKLPKAGSYVISVTGGVYNP